MTGMAKRSFLAVAATVGCALTACSLTACADEESEYAMRTVEDSRIARASQEAEESRAAEASREAEAEESRAAEASREARYARESRAAQASRSAEAEAARAQQQQSQEPVEQWPSPPNVNIGNMEWSVQGPYGTGTSTNCVQISDTWPSTYSECFRMSDGWYFYGARQSSR